ncbi:MAG: type II toxin-antitoxin system Phd/YefM family antitoxin [Deltaproteobacteria bacterium]|nr:type II toxin-antitoxin system Phd/YefM family antitoxin [Deltaproteobacteria bacterium]
MKMINIYNAKSQFSAIIEQVATRGTEFIIGKAGRAVAKIVPYKAARKKRRLDYLKGKIKTAPDFDQWPDDIALSLGITS